MKTDTHYKNVVSGAIRRALDAQGIEITWYEINPAADAVLESLADVFELAHRYEGLCD